MVLKGICCWGTEYCKCEFLGMTRNQNVKVGYLFLLLLALTVSALVGKIYSESKLYMELLGCDKEEESSYLIEVDEGEEQKEKVYQQ